MESPLTTISIPERFCGPVASANGGYICGILAQFIEGPAKITLKAPPPLDTPLTVEHIDQGKSLRLMYGEMEIASAASTSIDVTAPPTPSHAELKSARASYLSAQADHPLPGCFVCGPGRENGDGLRIFAGPVPGSPINADLWTPTEDLAATDGKIKTEFLWAAMDCPSAWATRVLLKDRLIILGQFSAEIFRRPKPGESLIITAWPIKADGRKHFSNVALTDEHNETIAVASAVWIEITDPNFLQFLKTGK